ncbi:hypothetical protein ACQKP6_09010 [Pseudomonas fluorescens]|uniref:hypothetical protein n=1 Tax=Pseudomonas fluorescens TaxID=294 RepID=UPI003D06B30A
MPDQYTLPDLLERMYDNQLALEAALMELTLWVEQRGSADVGENVRGALHAIGENAGHIKQGLARLKAQSQSGFSRPPLG